MEYDNVVLLANKTRSFYRINVSEVPDENYGKNMPENRRNKYSSKNYYRHLRDGSVDNNELMAVLNGVNVVFELPNSNLSLSL